MSKLTGYRELSEHEKQLANNVKALAETVGLMVEAVRMSPDADPRWVAEARTDLQKGFMSLVRAITRPTTF